MKVTLVCSGRFHHFHLARQLEKKGVLHQIFTGYPRFKLTNESGIPKHKIKTFPWLQVPALALRRIRGLPDALHRELKWQHRQWLDQHASRCIEESDGVIALSCSGLKTGQTAKSLGRFYICDRGSTHIRYQHNLLCEEYAKWGIHFGGIDPRVINKEEAEYALADRIFVPSEAAKRTFPASDPVTKISFGVDEARFQKTTFPPVDSFQLIFVGSVSIRKGIPYLLEAFSQFKHPKKHLRIVGSITPEIRPLLRRLPTDNVEFIGPIPNVQLAPFYSASHACVLPSVEEGMSLVQAEAMACGCPVICSENTGGADLFTSGVEGLIVKAQSSKALVDAFEMLACSSIQMQMSVAGQDRVLTHQTSWDVYGDGVMKEINSLQPCKSPSKTI